MARKREEIIAQMNQWASQHKELRELEQNTSRTSVWKYAKQVMAFAIQTLERMMDHHKEEIRKEIQTQKVGTHHWYFQKTLAFQYGDLLSVIDNEPRYLTLDPSKQIVKHAALSENAQGGLDIKVVKTDGRNDPVPLNMDEQSALLAYLNQIKFAGTKIRVISRPANLIGLKLQVEMDKQIFNSEGELLGQSGHYPVRDTMEKYLKNLPFDSILYISKLTDAIQALPGIEDVHFTETRFLNEETSSYEVFHRKLTAPAGHLALAESETQISYSFT
ncbi:MAG: hypothetical protein OXB93_03380 [Cytophagales bacterium]|nr:hypothetical protein [Cytophagales bacterium]